ncbi:unnamed protein product, partial [Discosporangium mesarthrocarpum]
GQGWGASPRGGSGDRNGAGPGVGEVAGGRLRSVQLDLRLSVLSKALQDMGDMGSAVLASARAVTLCPDSWALPPFAVSSSGANPTSGTRALTERYVACKLRAAARPLDSPSQSCDPTSLALGATGQETLCYLTDGQGLTAVPGLENFFSGSMAFPTGSRPATNLAICLFRQREQGLPLESVIQLLLEECRAYTLHLPSLVAGLSTSASRETVR